SRSQASWALLVDLDQLFFLVKPEPRNYADQFSLQAPALNDLRSTSTQLSVSIALLAKNDKRHNARAIIHTFDLRNAFISCSIPISV
ncbi:MAG: hypothetical protein AAFO76_07975, partial [Cyanobacteria bacterium J06607_15]